ncbi:hypothetical protein MRX96_008345 [Rhipicephalus microplus]
MIAKEITRPARWCLCDERVHGGGSGAERRSVGVLSPAVPSVLLHPRSPSSLSCLPFLNARGPWSRGGHQALSRRRVVFLSAHNFQALQASLVHPPLRRPCCPNSAGWHHGKHWRARCDDESRSESPARPGAPLGK